MNHPTDKSLLYSFIIPAKNEEKFIGNCIVSIKNGTCNDSEYEVIVIDNGSKDKTKEIATNYGAKVLTKNNSTIGGLRNYGASIARGEVFVFLDADVCLTPEWFENIPTYYHLIKNRLIISGSRCAVPEKPNWIERYWYSPLTNKKENYINSGHLIISKHLFNVLKGFSKTLKTGEDYDLSLRATKIGCSIHNNPQLKAIHLGYPQNLLHFIKREMWHGSSDFTSISAIKKSKVSLVTIIFLLCHVTGLTYWPLHSSIAIFLLCTTSATIKYKKTISAIPVNSLIYYFYFTGRALSLMKYIFSSATKTKEA